jgi:FkbM family methyltransferase
MIPFQAAAGERSRRARLAAASVLLAARWTPYVEAELLGLPALVGPGSVCVDVGSAAGLYTLALSRLAGPSGQVHSVEPLPFAHPVWTRLLRAREAGNVRHHPVALGAEAGSGLMSVPIGRCGPVTGRSFMLRHASGLGANAEFARHITVAVTIDTLDGLCARAGLTRLDFIKIDVEGAELQVLHGGRDTIESLRPALLIEIEARHTARYRYAPDDITGWLAQRGYTMYTWQRGWRQASRVCSRARNYLFRPPGRCAPCHAAA